MINYRQIQRAAAGQGVPEEIIEKDYLIELLLYYLAQDKTLKDKLIFRGGTALKKIYFPDYRFSEDLDFIVRSGADLGQIETSLAGMLERITADHSFRLSLKEPNEQERGRLQLFVLYDIFREIRAVKELKFDINRDVMISSYKGQPVKFTYPDFPAGPKLKTYLLVSIVSDKIGRILDVVDEPRDLYDLSYLLKQGLDVPCLKNEFKNKYGYDIPLANLLRAIAQDSYRQGWQLRLSKQIARLPHYPAFLAELTALIKASL